MKGLEELLRTDPAARELAIYDSNPAIRILAQAIDAELGAGVADGMSGAMPTGSGPRDWSEALALVAKRDGISLSQAGRVCMKEFSHLHPVAARGTGNGPPTPPANRRGTTPAQTHPGPAAPATGSEPRDWAEAVAFIQQRDGVRASEAGKRAYVEYPHLHPVNARRSRALAHA